MSTRKNPQRLRAACGRAEFSVFHVQFSAGSLAQQEPTLHHTARDQMVSPAPALLLGLLCKYVGIYEPLKVSTPISRYLAPIMT